MVSLVRPIPSCKDYSQLPPLLEEERLTPDEFRAIKKEFSNSFSTSLCHLFKACQASFLGVLEQLDLALLGDDALSKWDWTPLTDLIHRSWDPSIELSHLFGGKECNLEELIETATHAAFQISHLDSCDRGGHPTLRLHLYLGIWEQRVILCIEPQKNPYLTSPFYFFYFALSSLKAGIFTPFTEEFASPFQISFISPTHPTLDQLLTSQIILPFFSGRLTFHDPLGQLHFPRALRQEVDRQGHNPLPRIALSLLLESSLWPSLASLAERGAIDLLEELVYERDFSPYRSAVLTRASSRYLFFEIAKTYRHNSPLHTFILSFFSFDWSTHPAPELCKNIAEILFPPSPSKSGSEIIAPIIAHSLHVPRSEKERMLFHLFRFWNCLSAEESQRKVDAILRLT